ncbi:hypothetical protein SAMN05421856_11194 [Chryseobacterium taichungense]|uniref:Uncharacterized protein n=2 Tax=Chryseobacterium taichungense TaxID=295069 RepID=A0A1H8D303_9FLAO|nr:hypothetical protein [Chryseobacterium taichungense]SEN01683.1 hypothetical protein SAMN05421856_11194 [Chryseobacterium taichungense]
MEKCDFGAVPAQKGLINKPSKTMTYIKIIIFCVVFYILGSLQSYISLYSLKDNLSSSCMECSFLDEVLYTNSLNFIGMLFVLLTIKFFKISKKALVIIIIIFFTILSIMVNSNIFDTREASWSTFLYYEIIAYGISSLLPFIFISWGIIVGMIILGTRK